MSIHSIRNKDSVYELDARHNCSRFNYNISVDDSLYYTPYSTS